MLRNSYEAGRNVAQSEKDYKDAQAEVDEYIAKKKDCESAINDLKLKRNDLKIKAIETFGTLPTWWTEEVNGGKK